MQHRVLPAHLYTRRHANGTKLRVCLAAVPPPQPSYTAVNVLPSACRYACSPCSGYNKTHGFKKGHKQRRKASFNAWDQGVIARLDSYVTNAFPFMLTRKSGVAKTLVARLADDLINGKGFSATSNFFREAYMNSYMTQYSSYVSLVNHYRSSIGAQLRIAAGEGAPEIPAFGGFHDRQGFNGAWPSDAYLRAVWHKWFYEAPVIQVRSFMQ